jgi:hypothetical protein
VNAATFARRRATGGYSVDAWGLDPDLVDVVAPVAGWRWSVEVDGAHHIPSGGPAMVVFNRRFGLSEPPAVVVGLRRATGRPVRMLGVPDVAPVGPWLRRLGGAVDAPAEVAGLLRAGELVAVPMGAEPTGRRRAGRLDPLVLDAALDQRVPILPVAALGHELGRYWRVVIGPDVVPPPDKLGSRHTAEMVDLVRTQVQATLDGARSPHRFWR